MEILDQCTRLTRDINQDSLSAQTKYTELVMKCIWKMTKLIPQLIESKSIDIGVLLFDVHNFLIASPPSEWKRRTTQKIIPQADMPLRTVKTILHEIVTVMEDRVFEHLEHIQDLKTSHAVVYLRQMVENEHKKKYGTSYKPSATFEAATSQDIVSAGPGMMATVPEVHASISSTHCSPITKRPLSMPPSIRNEMMQQQLAISGEGCSPTAVAGSGSGSASLNTSAQGSPVSVEQLSNEQVNARLAVIFEKIRDKEQTKQAIADLYNFQKQNPYITGLVDIHLNRTNTYFQGYIRRGLQSLADEDDGSRSSPVKRPMSMMASYRPSSTISAEESIGGPKGEWEGKKLLVDDY